MACRETLPLVHLLSEGVVAAVRARGPWPSDDPANGRILLERVDEATREAAEGVVTREALDPFSPPLPVCGAHALVGLRTTLQVRAVLAEEPAAQERDDGTGKGMQRPLYLPVRVARSCATPSGDAVVRIARRPSVAIFACEVRTQELRTGPSSFEEGGTGSFPQPIALFLLDHQRARVARSPISQTVQQRVLVVLQRSLQLPCKP